MTYLVKEIFNTLQGEGMRTGRAAVFCRFAGCNLWSGREEHRAGAACRFCDTDFVGTDGPGGGRFGTAADLAGAVRRCWVEAVGAPPGESSGYVVCTGGEPALQLDEEAVAALHDAGFEMAVETNGTVALPEGIDWVCVSPKSGTEVVVRRGDELKLVFPQEGLVPADVARWDFDHLLLQPMDGPHREPNTVAAVEYCRAHPPWRLSLQTHKYLGIP